MPTPLTAKSSGNLSWWEQVILFFAVGVPAAGLWYCFNYHRQIHSDTLWLNLCAHAGLIVFPLIWLCLFNYRPVVYESSDADIVLGRTSYFGTLRTGWWAMFIMRATPVFAVVDTSRTLDVRYLQHPEELSTSPGRAIYIMAVIFWLGAFYSAILLGKSEPATRISNEGLRTGILRFFKWEDIHHMSRHENLYAIYHQANPALPATSFRVYTQESQAILERFLSAHQVRISNDSDPAYLTLRIAVVLGFAANLLAAFWLRWNTPLSLTSILLISFGIGIIMTMVLEKYRGVSKFGKYKPVVQLGDIAAPGNLP